MIECAIDFDGYVEFYDGMHTSAGTEQCDECHELIHAGTEHYKYYQWAHDEWGDEAIKSVGVCCEKCGDLALSFLEAGFCWAIGDLRGDITERQDFL